MDLHSTDTVFINSSSWDYRAYLCGATVRYASEVNIPCYASGIVTADEIIVAISSLSGIEVAAQS